MAWVTVTPWVLGMGPFLAPIRVIPVVETLALALSAVSKNRMLQNAAAMILMSLLLSAMLLIVPSAVRS